MPLCIHLLLRSRKNFQNPNEERNRTAEKLMWQNNSCALLEKFMVCMYIQYIERQYSWAEECFEARRRYF